MASAPNQAKAIFLAALENHAPDQWPAYLDQVCAGDVELRHRVEALLQAHLEAASVLNPPGQGPTSTIAQPPPEGAGAVIGPYKLLQQIGEGGMGSVFMAEQTQPVQRKVALKIIKPGMDSRQVIARFEAERQALALMDHPNIAKVFDGGATDSGRPYFVMELVKGVSITKYCDEHRLTPKQRLELFVPVCQAVQHAHQKGIIHRDLKPSNVLVALYDDKPVPKVIDFGIAKATGQKLTERTLFTESEVEQALERERLSSYWQSIALAEREWSASNLLRSQELLDLCPENLRGWEWHYLKRLRGKALPPLRHDHPVRAVALSPDGKRIVSADMGGFVTIWDTETGVRLHHVRGHDKPTDCIAFSPNGGRFATGDYDPTGQRKAVVKVWDGQTGKELARWEIQRSEISALVFSADGKLACSSCNQVGAGAIDMRDPMTGAMLFEFGESKEGSNCLAFTPDGKLLAEGSLGGEVKLWDVGTRECVRTLRVGRLIRCMALSRDGLLLAAGYGDEGEKGNGKVLIWEVQTGHERPALIGQAARSVAFSPDGSRLATGGTDQAVKIWDAATGHEILTLRGHFDWVQGLAFTPDGRRLVTAGDDKKILVWDARPLREGEKIGEELFMLAGHGDSVKAVAFHPTRPLLATGSADGTVKMWDTRTGQEERPLLGGLKRVDTVAFTPDGKRVAVAGQPPTFVTILDSATGAVGRQVKVHGEWLMKVAFSPDGKTLATGGNHGTVVLHDAVTGNEVGSLPGHRRVVYDLAFHPDASKPLLASTDSLAWTVRVWTTKPLAVQPDATLSHQGTTYCVAFSPDGRLLATGGWDRMVRVWDTTTWKQVDFWRDPSGAVQSLAFSPDGRLIAWGSTDSTVKVWQRESGEVVPLRGHTDAILGIAFSRDGKLIASASNDGTARVWVTPSLP